ncbi:MAG TPA: hypothetical protein EYN06_02650 [Myxococcales bacterium]|nr:hypothetical protein [Myxococcales bacterium]HIN85353.1 hypothetical protein [Myxococcales bacterium]
MSSESQEKAISPIESWAYIHSFLIWLVACFGVITLLLTVYNQLTQSKTDEAAALLTEGADAEQLKSVFERLKDPHLLSGWRVPDSIVPGFDPRLSDLTEDGLLEAAMALPEFPAPKGSVKHLNACNKNQTCIISALGTTRRGAKRPPYSNQIYRYLFLSRAMAAAQPVTDEQIRYFKTHITLWVRAFERQIINGKGTATTSDRSMLELLLESRQTSLWNTWLFCGYGGIAFMILGSVLLVWRRRRHGLEAKDNNLQS